MGLLNSILGVGKGVISGDWGSALESGAGLLDAAGPAIIGGVGQAQADKELNSSLEKVIGMIKEQEAQDYARRLQEYEAAKSASAANQASKRAAARKAAMLQQAYYERAQKMLAPYANAAKAELPIRADIYKQGMSILGNALGGASGALAGMPQGAKSTAIKPKVNWNG